MLDENVYRIINGNSLEVLDTLPENSVGSIVCDPPYELGFMGKSWDSTGIAYNVELWKKALKVLKPGGYLLAFGGSRTFHRIACAIEDGGFEIRDTIMWLYGSGFPKSLNVGVGVDKKRGIESKVVGIGKSGSADTHTRCMNSKTQSGEDVFGGEFEIKKANNEWSGYGTCLKPAFEPIIVARKPVEGTIVDNCLTYNVGAINIDECRIPIGDEKVLVHNAPKGTFAGGEADRGSTKNEDGSITYTESEGRYPANLVLTYDKDNEGEVCSGFPYTKSEGGNNYNKNCGDTPNSMFGLRQLKDDICFHDSGSAARYFYNAEYNDKDIEPNCKPIIVARKPLDGTVVENVLKHGVGAINIDECRIPLGNGETKKGGFGNAKSGFQKGIGNSGDEEYKCEWVEDTNGRFPANVVLTYDKGDEAKVCGGMPYSDTPNGSITKNYKMNNQVYGDYGCCKTFEAYQDSGSASRYFYNAQYDNKDNDIKPCCNPIIVARKPLEGTVVENCLEYGVGAINIDECRVPLEEGYKAPIRSEESQQHCDNRKGATQCDLGNKGDYAGANPDGRYPSNVITDGSEEATKDMPESKGGQGKGFSKDDYSTEGNMFSRGDFVPYNDSGSASRYFYCAKASSKDRDEGLDMFESKKCSMMASNDNIDEDGNFTGMLEGRETMRKNIHPTVKPTSLMQYLVRLVTPKGQTVLDIFNGSGSTGKAVAFENRERNANYKYIGIELSAEYVEITKARIDYAVNQYEYEQQKQIEEQKKEAEEKGQMSLFDFTYEE